MYSWAMRYSSTVIGRGIRYSFIIILESTPSWRWGTACVWGLLSKVP
jgi:hypothetical protein